MTKLTTVVGDVAWAVERRVALVKKRIKLALVITLVGGVVLELVSGKYNFWSAWINLE